MWAPPFQCAFLISWQWFDNSLSGSPGIYINPALLNVGPGVALTLMDLVNTSYTKAWHSLHENILCFGSFAHQGSPVFSSLPSA